MNKRIVWLGIGILLTSGFCRRQGLDVRFPGLVDGQIFSVQALSSGTIETIPVQEGQRVKKGQLLLELNREKIENSLQELEINERDIFLQENRARVKIPLVQANVKYWQNQLDRLTRLKQSDSIPGEQWEKTRLQWLEAQTSWKDLQQTLDGFSLQRDRIRNKRENLRLLEKDLRFSSPAEGVILDILVSPGQNVIPGTPLLELLDSSSLYVEAFVEERELSWLRLNDPVTIVTDGESQIRRRGFIRYFGKKAEFSPKYIISETERQSLLYQVKIGITDPDVFKVGMPVTVVFHKKQHS